MPPVLIENGLICKESPASGRLCSANLEEDLNRPQKTKGPVGGPQPSERVSESPYGLTALATVRRRPNRIAAPIPNPKSSIVRGSGTNATNSCGGELGHGPPEHVGGADVGVKMMKFDGAAGAFFA